MFPLLRGLRAEKKEGYSTYSIEVRNIPDLGEIELGYTFFNAWFLSSEHNMFIEIRNIDKNKVLFRNKAIKDFRLGLDLENKNNIKDIFFTPTNGGTFNFVYYGTLDLDVTPGCVIIRGKIVD